MRPKRLIINDAIRFHYTQRNSLRTVNVQLQSQPAFYRLHGKPSTEYKCSKTSQLLPTVNLLNFKAKQLSTVYTVSPVLSTSAAKHPSFYLALAFNFACLCGSKEIRFRIDRLWVWVWGFTRQLLIIFSGCSAGASLEDSSTPYPCSVTTYVYIYICI